MWDIFCVACGGPCYSMDGGDRTHEWLNKFVVLTTDMRAVKCTQYNGDGSFAKPKETTTNIHSVGWNGTSLSRFGVGMHVHCHKYIQRESGIALRFNHFNAKRILNKQLNNTYDGVNYGNTNHYWQQLFHFTKVMADKHEYIFASPLSDTADGKKNAMRISRIFKQFSIKNNKRPSPQVSATMFKEGEAALGGNGKAWKVKGGKWVQLDEGELLQITIPEDAHEVMIALEPVVENLCIIKTNKINKKETWLLSGSKDVVKKYAAVAKTQITKHADKSAEVKVL